MAEPETDSNVDLREYGRVLRRRLPVIIITFVVVVAIAIGLSLLQTKTYSATAHLLVPQTSALQQLNTQTNAAQANPQASQRAMQNAVNFAESDQVKAAAARNFGRPAHVSVGSDANADVLTFTAHNTDRAEAARTANAYAQAFTQQSAAASFASYTSLVDALNTKLAQLRAQQAGLKPGSTGYQALQAQIDTLGGSQSSLLAAAQVAEQSGATMTQRATVPTSPSSPKTLRNGLLAGVLGLIIGIGLAFLVDRLDESIKSKHDLEGVSAGIPVLGLVPEVAGWRNHRDAHVITLESPRSPAAETYRTLRTSVQFLGIERPLRVLGITSAAAAEGKTTTIANLAVAYADAGQRVVIASCDMRKPRIHDFFGLSNDKGLTSVLLGEVALDEALQTVDDVPRVSLLAAGPTPPNPAELLGLQRVHQVIASLGKVADLVLVDSPPVLPVTDALLVSKFVDGMIVVAEARSTGRREMHRALELLDQVDAPLIGTVLNNVPSKGGYDYGYGYSGYGYRYTGPEAEVSPNGAEAELPVTRPHHHGADFERVVADPGTHDHEVPPATDR